MKPDLDDDAVRDAVLYHDKLVFIEAGPGTGKTTVAVERFGVYRFTRIRPGGGGVRMLAFTRAVTAELRRRIRARWGEGALSSDLGSVSTIDGDFHRVLEFLRANDLIDWPENPPAVTPVNSWSDVDGVVKYNYGEWQNDTYRVSLVDGKVVTITDQKAGPSEWYIGKTVLTNALKHGVCTHEDVRTIVIEATQPGTAAADAVVEWLRRRVAHLIVDEVFDADEADLTLIDLYRRADSHITVIGDPWQALYEWRKSVPATVRSTLIASDFVELALQTSRRFQGSMVDLTATLRGNPTALPPLFPAEHQPNVVLAPTWRHLWDLPDWVLPLAHRGRLSTITDAFVTLFIDELAQLHLGEPSPLRAEAVRIVFQDDDTVGRLTTELVPVREALLQSPADGLAALRASHLGGRQPTALAADREAALLQLMDRIARRLHHTGTFTKGLSVHQAKGCEWDHVGAYLDDRDRSSLTQGLDQNNAQDRVVYVALTRAKHTTVLIEPPPG